MSISDIMTIIGIPTLFGTLVYMGRQLQILSHLTVTVEKMKGNIKVIADALTNSNIPFDCKKIQSYSPLRLTDEEVKFLQEVGFIDIFMQNEKAFFDHIDEDKPQIDYDVEKSAI